MNAVKENVFSSEAKEGERMKVSEEFAKIGYLAIFVCMPLYLFCDYSKDILIVPCIFLAMAIIALFMNS